MPEPDTLHAGWPVLAGLFLLGYLCGSVPFGLILTRLAGLGDIRAIGSGNIGATNVLRTGRKGLAAATLLLDAMKGTAAVTVGWRWGLDGAVACALGAMIGHCFPVWLRFRGGKGVATFLGVLLGLHWPTMAITVVIWIATAAMTRYSSLSALLASAAAPLLLVFFGRGEAAACVLALTLLVWFRHRANLKRLMAGEESRIGQT